MAEVEGISEYERYRLANISKYESFLNSIGLPNTNANNLYSPANDGSTTSGTTNTLGIKKRRRTFSSSASAGERGETQRSSRRLQKLSSVDFESLPNNAKKEIDSNVNADTFNKRLAPQYSVDITIDEEEGLKLRKHITLQAVREHISSISSAHALLISDEEIEHCLYRVRYMSTAKLATRLKQIAR